MPPFCVCVVGGGVFVEERWTCGNAAFLHSSNIEHVHKPYIRTTPSIQGTGNIMLAF